MPSPTNEILNPLSLNLPQFAAADLPVNAQEGDIAYDQTNKKIVFRDNGAWRTVTSA